MSAINIISATRHTEERFWSESLLGRSLKSFTAYRFVPRIAFENNDGLSTCYNRAIAQCAADDILVFVHDDVLFADLYWIDHLLQALQRFHVVGVAGTMRRAPRQVKWFWGEDPAYEKDATPLSGYIGNGEGLPCKVSAFGPVGRTCQLLDGVFLATRKQTLSAAGISFDERFTFHFYDLDFCRAAETKGFKMGTASISLVHRSEGDFASPAWTAASEAYLAKWGE